MLSPKSTGKPALAIGRWLRAMCGLMWVVVMALALLSIGCAERNAPRLAIVSSVGLDLPSVPIEPDETLGQPTSYITPVPEPQAAATGAKIPPVVPPTASTPTPAADTSPARNETLTAQRHIGPPSVPPSPRFEPSALETDALLEAQIRGFLGEEVGGYGVVVKRLADGRGAAVNPDRQFYAASLYKLLVMYEVYKQRSLGILSFDETLAVTPAYLDYLLGDLRWSLGNEVPIGELVDAMITVSDNIAAVMLLDRAGGWNIIQDLRAIGLEHTDISTEDIPTSAGDMARLLEMMATGEAVDHGASQEIIELLCRQEINDRLPALLPAGTVVAHKTGNWDNATHDVGVVYSPGGAYVIAVLSEKPGDSDVIAELSLLVYGYFN